MIKRLRLILFGVGSLLLVAAIGGCDRGAPEELSSSQRRTVPSTTAITEPATTTTTIPEPYPYSTFEFTRPDGWTYSYTPFRGSQWKLSFSKNIATSPPGFAKLIAQTSRPSGFPGKLDNRNPPGRFGPPGYFGWGMPVRWEMPIAANIFGNGRVLFENVLAAADCALSDDQNEFYCTYHTEPFFLTEPNSMISTYSSLPEAQVDAFIAAVGGILIAAPTVDVEIGFSSSCMKSYNDEYGRADLYMRKGDLTIKLQPGRLFEVLNNGDNCWPPYPE